MKLRSGIGAGIGSLIGLAVIVLKQLKIWPFNRKKKAPKQTEEQAEELIETSQKHRKRNHPRSWNSINEFTTRANFG